MQELNHITPSLRPHARPIAELTKDPENVRLHGVRNLEAIVGSLRKFGQQRPILVDAEGKVIAGNGTLAGAVEIGWEQIAVTESDLTGSAATGYAIADNQTATLAEWDREALARQLESLRDEDADLALATGHTLDEVAALISEAQGRPQLPPDASGKVYTESVAAEVKTVTCPKCETEVPV